MDSRIIVGIIGAIATIIAAIIIASHPTPMPTPTPMPMPTQMPTPQIAGGEIMVECSANPHVLSPGSQTELVIQAISSQNIPVSDANVRVAAGGGTFLSSGSTTVVGRTDYSGAFRTIWEAPSPAAAGYIMGVYVSKPGFVEGRGECRTIIQ